MRASVRTIQALALALGLIAGCGSELPAGSFGSSIRGTVRYGGDRLEGLERPTLAVLVVLEPWTSTDWSTWVWPNAFRIYDPVELVDGAFDYAVEGVEPGRFEVMGFLGAAFRPATDPIAIGAFPNLLQMGTRPVEVRADAPTEGVDFELYEADWSGL